MLHYHSAGSCIGDPSINNTGGFNGDGKDDIAHFIANSWSKKPFRTALGVSKDGRVIYSPLYNNGSAYASCDVDLCNGRLIGGQYAYVATLFHPFVMGCYGPGSYPTVPQQCSLRPRVCNKTAASALSNASPDDVMSATIVEVWSIFD
jgi:hypothetical protein